MNRVLVVAALSLLTAWPSRAQNDVSAAESRSDVSFEQAISGNDVPLQIRFGSMDKSWRQMQISGSDEDLLSQLYQSSNPRNFQPQIFYTRGQTVKFNGELLVMAYKITLFGETKTMRDRFGNSPNLPQVTPQLALDTPLELTLLNSRLISRFSAIRVLDVAQEIRQSAIATQNARQELTKAVNAASLSNLQQIGQQIRSYTQSTGKLPPLQTSAVTQKALQRFGYSSPSPFVHPATGKPYATNVALSGKTLKQIVDTSRAIVFYENEVSGDGTRGVVFADGNATRVSQNEFASLQSKIGFSTKAKLILLYGASALRYLYEKNSNVTQPYFRSETSGRIYYRDLKTHQPIFVAPPTKPLILPDFEAVKYKDYAGYNGQKTGKAFGGYGYNPN